MDNRPCLARITGGAFTVYPTKGCPPLGPSTELTKVRASWFHMCIETKGELICASFRTLIQHLARAGVRVNARTSEWDDLLKAVSQMLRIV
jgi:hypothetical protein